MKASAYVLPLTATTHHKQQLLGPLHVFQELVAHAFVYVSALNQAWEVGDRNLPKRKNDKNIAEWGETTKKKPIQRTVKGQ